MNLVIGNLNSDIAKAQTINSFFPDGEFSEAVESLNEAGVRKDSNHADFKNVMLMPENERMAGFATLLPKINYSEQPQLFNSVVDRYTKSEKSISEMNKEMMADPLFKTLVENDLSEIRNISQGIFDKNKYSGMNEQEAIQSLMDRVKNRPLEYQNYIKEQREEFKTSIPEVESNVEESEKTKNIMEDSDIGLDSAKSIQSEEPDSIKQEDKQVVKSGGVSFEVPINSLNDDMKKLFESDYMSKIKNTRAKERSQVISNILGRKISEEESEALLSELSSIKIQALTKKGLEDIKKGVGASLKEKRYPQKAGRSTYRAQG
jgi:hypothetical protein